MRKITKNSKKAVESILQNTNITSNFTCFPQLFAFCTNTKQKLYQSEVTGEPRLILHKQGKIGEVRILFTRSPKDAILIDEIKREFKPKCIAYNVLKVSDVPKNVEAKARAEQIINNKTVATLEDSRIRKHFKAAERRHPYLKYIPATKEDKSRILAFLDEWCETVGITFTPKSSAINDRRLVELFLGTENIQGSLAIDKNKIIGIEFHCSHPVKKDLAAAIVCKNLRGYTYLGDWLTVQRQRRLLNEGFKETIIGGLDKPRQAKFKRKFSLNGREVNYYSYSFEGHPFNLTQIWN